MKPTKFKEQNCTFAENQPEYLPLPAHRDMFGRVTTCWELSWMERLKILFTGKVWVAMLSFNAPLTPLLLQIDCPFYHNMEGEAILKAVSK